MKKNLALFLVASLFAGLSATTGFAQYNQTNVNTLLLGGSNPVEKSATIAPNDLAAFSVAVSNAFNLDIGGVFNLPTTVAGNTTNFSGTYGVSLTRRLQIRSSVNMQNVTGTGSFTPVSGVNATTSSADNTGYNLRLGPVTTIATGLDVAESVTQVGFVILSRTAAGYPLDVRATAFFSDGSTQAVTATLLSPKSADDTFYGFTAPTNTSITNIFLQSFATGTVTAVSSRICFDDFGFITSSSGALPLPQVLNVSPFNFAIVSASVGVQFQAFSLTNIDPSGIKLVLNNTNVSDQLTITGASTNHSVSFTNLLPNQTYTVEITVSNAAGVVTQTNSFYTHETWFTLFGPQSFSDPSLYPIGPLGFVVDGGSLWIPATNAGPAEITDSGEVDHGKILRRQQVGTDATDFLIFPGVANGIIRIGLDARVSDVTGRTLDLCLQMASGLMTSFLAYGTNANNFSYFDSGTGLWTALTNADTAWHHLEITNYLTGANAGKFDLSYDGVLIGNKLNWRHAIPAQTSINRIRVGAIRSSIIGAFGDVDNLVVAAAPAPAVGLPMTILNPARAGDSFSFSFLSQTGFSHVIQFRDSFSTGTWTNLTTIVGDGSIKNVTNSNPVSDTRFYRVQTQ